MQSISFIKQTVSKEKIFMLSISFIKQTVSKEKIFKDFFRKFALFGAPATNQNKRSG